MYYLTTWRPCFPPVSAPECFALCLATKVGLSASAVVRAIGHWEADMKEDCEGGDSKAAMQFTLRLKGCISLVLWKFVLRPDQKELFLYCLAFPFRLQLVFSCGNILFANFYFIRVHV